MGAGGVEPLYPGGLSPAPPPGRGLPPSRVGIPQECHGNYSSGILQVGAAAPSFQTNLIRHEKHCRGAGRSRTSRGCPQPCRPLPAVHGPRSGAACPRGWATPSQNTNNNIQGPPPRRQSINLNQNLSRYSKKVCMHIMWRGARGSRTPSGLPAAPVAPPYPRGPGEAHNTQYENMSSLSPAAVLAGSRRNGLMVLSC